MVRTSLKRSSYPGSRWYRTCSISGPLDYTKEASRSFSRAPRHPRLVRKPWTEDAPTAFPMSLPTLGGLVL
jgi:hypothetical protein